MSHEGGAQSGPPLFRRTLFASGPEWQLLHEVKEEKVGIREEIEGKQDPQTLDIPNSFMYEDREEIMMEGAEGIKAHNVIPVGGEKRIGRSKKAKTRQTRPFFDK